MYKEVTANRAAGRALSVASVLAALFAWPATAHAQSVVAQGVAVGVSAPVAQATMAQAFWSADRLMNARPMDVHPSDSFAMQPLSAGQTPREAPQGAPMGAPGSAPTVVVQPNENNMVHPPISLENNVMRAPFDLDEGGVTPAFSMSDGMFTESRVFPASAVSGSPYRAAGALFFHDPNTAQDFICSASMISPRLILTAGHCVSHGSTVASQRYFYTNFLFIPAYDNGSAPTARGAGALRTRPRTGSTMALCRMRMTLA